MRPVVMVIEDEETVREAICDVLDFEGYEPLPQRRPEAALACLEGGATPATIVLDLALPGMGGAGFLAKLRAAPRPMSSLPVLLLSAWENLDRHGLAADGVLRKPADPVTLARAVDKLARRTPPPDTRVGGPEREALSVESQRYSPWVDLYGVAMIGTMRSGRQRAHLPPAVLIVEDDELVAKGAVDAVAALGYRTIHVRDGWQALDALAREQPAVLLVDLSLPGMSGSEFLRFVRNNPVWSRIPRVILTGTNDPMIGVREDAPVFYKPLDIDSLAAVVQRYCERPQPQPSAAFTVRHSHG